MNVSAPFIRRPVATGLLVMTLVVFGVLAFLRLPVSALPNVDFPTIQVSAALPGASPETMAASVATPLEREFSSIDGVASMNSSSSLSNTTVTLQFNLTRNLDSAAQDVQAAISRAARNLPAELPAPPSYRKVNPADLPILYLVLSSRSLPLYKVDDYAETRLAQIISTVPGVAQVQVFGSQKYAVRVQVDPARLASRQIGIDEVAQAVQNANPNLPTGTIWGKDRAFTVDTSGSLVDAAGFRPVIVAYKDGAPVRLEDIGQVLDSVEDDKTAAFYNDDRAVILAIQKQPGSNTVAVSDGVKALLPGFRATLPAAVNLQVLLDRAVTIRESVRDVELTLLLTLALVVLVIFVFLNRLTATLIPSIAMPIAVVGTFAVMYLLGYSLDNLSLMALTLSVGFVVDDAVVMLENVVRHLEMGKKPLQAALDGSSEVGFTIVSMTLSLVAVFIPFLFMGGIIGRLFEEFAVTIAVAIMISGLVSLTLTPLLASRILRGAEHESARPAGRLERAFELSRGYYDRSLRFVLKHRPLTLGFSLLTLVATVLLFMHMPKGFLPTEDTDQIFATTEAEQGVSFSALVERQQQVGRVVRQNPNVEALITAVGGNAAATNSGRLFARLKPRADRKDSIDDVLREVDAAAQRVPGIRSFFQAPPSIRIGGVLTKSQYQVTLRGADTDALYPASARFQAELARSPAVQRVTSDLLLKNPELYLAVDRDRSSALGVSANAVEDALYSAYGVRQVSTIYAPSDTYRVILEVDPKMAYDPALLALLHVRSSNGELVPLETLTRSESRVGPLTVNHAGQLPAVTVSFDVSAGRGLSEAVTATERAARTLPLGVVHQFQGAAQAFQSSFAGIGLLLIVAIFVIYVVLGVLYESTLHPITILSALPFAGFGALFALFVFGRQLDIYGFVGLILLVGLVKKNGIMMVDFAIESRKAGKNAEESIHEASLVRFRPIMMTTLAALFGSLPIALGLGAGAESRQPLGIVVVGGLLFSQLITLYVTPVFYVYLEHARERWLHFQRMHRRSPEAHAGT